MADTERNEDQKISRCLQEAFGYTDEQLLKQLDQANETLKDVTFDGAEDRIMKKIMARKAEMEKETAAPESETKRKITLVEAEPESKKEKKIVRFGKKKVLATVALVAVIAGMLGGTAVGKRSYFFKSSSTISSSIRLDNNKNKQEVSKLEAIYLEIGEKMKSPVLKLGYYPKEMDVIDYEIRKDESKIRFTYGNNIVNFYQMESQNSTSINYGSDRKDKNKVENKIINREIEYSKNDLEGGISEYEMVLVINNTLYYLCGIMPEEEFRAILKNLTFF